MSEQEIYIEAQNRRDPAERCRFLDDACAGNAALRERIETLIRQADQLGGFLENSPLGATADNSHAPEKPGTQIGPYKLLQQIGEGGMGVVYMAEQLEPVKRRVALKIIKPGMDTRQVIARFEVERQALSLMDHPNIAKVLDAGTTESGRPFFVMELVKGQPITQYCDEHHLTPRQRLELLLPICQAIQHAHQKGIIHRDIKPTNILVAEYDQQPVPKVIDFGVAKATSQTLTEKTMFTGLGQIVGTLEYMSPEQAKVNQLDIDTRSDIYSLGVLLYELLTGSTPFNKERLRSAAFDEMLRIIREEDPPKPSTRLSDSHNSLASISALRHTEPAKLTKLVRGELDWIVMKALEKDRNRRYETANGFAADVQRYLADEAVQACPPSAGYRLRKFTRRNKGGLAVAALVLFFLVLLGSGVGWAVRDRSAREAEIAQERANREAELTREREARRAKVAGQVESIFADVDRLENEQKWPEALAAARRAEAAVAGGEADAATAQRVRGRLKDLAFIERLEQIRMMRATWIGGAFDNAGVDRAYVGAFRDYGVDVDNLAIEESIHRLKTRPPLIIPLASVLDDWVFVRRWVSEGDAGGWKRLITVARGIDPEPLRDRLRSTWGQPAPEVKDELCQLARSIDIRAHQPATLVSVAYTLLRAKQSDAALRLLHDSQHVYPADFWLTFELGLELGQQNNLEGAIRFYTAAVSIRPRSTAAHNNLGIALHNHNKLDEAVAAYRKAIEIDPRFAIAYNNLAFSLRAQNKLDEAVATFRKAIEIDPNYIHPYNNLGLLLDDKLSDHVGAIKCFRKAIEINPNSTSYNNLGTILCDKLRDSTGAIECFRKAIEIDPQCDTAYHNLGNTLSGQNKLDEAIDAYRQAIEINPRSYGAYYYNLGVTLREQNKLDEAVAAYRKAIEINPKDVAACFNLAVALRAQNKLDEAIEACRKTIQIDPNNAKAYFHLARALRDQKKWDEAIDAYRTAIQLRPNNAETHHDLGIALWDQKKWSEAIAAFRKSIELDPKNTEYYGNLGSALFMAGNPDEAIAAYRRVIEIEPISKRAALAYFRMGKALELQGKLDETIACFRKACELDQKFAQAHSCLAWLLTNGREANLRDAAGGLDAARKAVEAAPQSYLAGHVLGWAYYRAGDWKSSIEALNKSCALDAAQGGDAFAWYFLAMAHWRLGEKDKAREWYEKAVQWMQANAKDNSDLARFRTEAEELIKKEPAVGNQEPERQPTAP